MNDWEILQSQNRMHTGFYIMRYPPCAASVAKPWGNHYDASTFFSFVTILYQYREVKGTQDVIGCGILWDWFLIYCTVLYISFWQFHEIVTVHLQIHIGAQTNSRHLSVDIFKCIFFNKNVWLSIKISVTFVAKGPINNIPALDKIMASSLPDDEIVWNICVTRPQWITNCYHGTAITNTR